MGEPAKRQSKAQQFALVAEGLGWTVERVKSKKPDKPHARRVIATRGEERYVMTWDRPTGDRENFMGGTYTIGEHTEPVKLVKAAQEAMAGIQRTAHVHENGHVARLPFDPALSTDSDVLAAVAGKTITWWNELADGIESGLVPRGGLHLKMETTSAGRRVLSFINAGKNEAAFRAVDLATIRSVS